MQPLKGIEQRERAQLAYTALFRSFFSTVGKKLAYHNYFTRVIGKYRCQGPAIVARDRIERGHFQPC